MTILKEIKSNFTIRLIAQGAPYFNILETQGLAEGFWNIKKGKGKIIKIFWEDKEHIPKWLSFGYGRHEEIKERARLWL